MTTLADFYSDRTTPAQIRAAGFDGASCYVSHQAGKNSTPEELHALRADGLIVGINFEDSATNALDGYSQGQRDGAFARDCGLALGYPAGLLVPLSVDFDAQAQQYAAIVAYFKGAVAELGPYTAADYGSFAVVELLHAELGLYGWQAAAWSYGRRSAFAYLYQDRYGQQFDADALEFNVPLWGLEPDPAKPSFAAHTAAKTSAKPAVATLVSNEGNPMLQIVAHGKNHLFHVQADGKLVWRAHQPSGTWAATALTAGATPASPPALWTSTGPSEVQPKAGEARPIVEFLHASVALADGKVWHGWNQAGLPWKTQTWPAV